MERVLLIIGCVAVGGIAIFGAIQTLNSFPTVGESRANLQSEEGPARSVVVRMEDIQFKPRVVSLRGGLAVEWSNDDDVVHTVEQIGREGEDFGSGRIAPGETYEHTFIRSGVYRYRCSIHPRRMRGQVSVLGD